jgi:hypothetical protein
VALLIEFTMCPSLESVICEGVTVKAFYEFLVVLHWVGISAIAWGIFSELRHSPRKVNAAMLHGASLQFVTGVLMVGLHGKTGEPALNMGSISIKLLVVLIMLAVISKGKRVTEGTNKYWAIVLVLWVTNVIIGSTLGK